MIYLYWILGAVAYATVGGIVASIGRTGGSMGEDDLGIVLAWPAFLLMFVVVGGFTVLGHVGLYLGKGVASAPSAGVRWLGKLTAKAPPEAGMLSAPKDDGGGLSRADD